MSINIGQLLGAALVGGIAASMGGGAQGFQASYLFMGAVTILMLFVALGLHSKRKLEAHNKAAET